jgi:hypothetical protein
MIPTQITTTVDQDLPFNKVITYDYGEFSFNQWLATLNTEDQQEWEKQSHLHNTAVDAAVVAGDARVTHNIKNSTIEWRTEEIHLCWMNTVDAKDQAIFHSFWDRYHTAAAGRKE